MGNYAEAATAVEQLIAKYPDTKSVRSLVFLADYHRRAGHIEAAKATLKEAMKLDPGDGESQLLLVDVLRQVGQIDDAVQVLRDANKKEPNNPIYELTLADLLCQDRSQRRGDQALGGHAQAPCRQRRGRDGGTPEPVGHLREPGRLRQGRGPARDAPRSATRTIPGPTTTWDTSTPSRARTSRKPKR